MANKRNKLSQNKAPEHTGRKSQKKIHARINNLKFLIRSLYQTAYDANYNANSAGVYNRGYGYGMVQRLTNSQPTLRGSFTLADKLDYWENAHMEALASAAEEMRGVQDAGGQGAGDIAGGVGMELEL